MDDFFINLIIVLIVFLVGYFLGHRRESYWRKRSGDLESLLYISQDDLYKANDQNLALRKSLKHYLTDAEIEQIERKRAEMNARRGEGIR